MGWASDQAHIVGETLKGAFVGDRIVTGVAAVDADGPTTLVSAGCPPDARFELGSVTKR